MYYSGVNNQIERTFDYLYNLIKNGPTDFSTQKKYIDLFLENKGLLHYYVCYAIPDKYLLPQTVSYTLSKDASFISKFPELFRTREMFIIAIRASRNSPGNVIKVMPKEFFDSDICRECVLKNVKMIRKIPVRIITEEFVQSLIDASVNLSSEMDYINHCLKVNKQVTGEENISCSNIEVDSDKYKDFEKILLSDLVIFNKLFIGTLEAVGINTLKELFEVFDKGMIAELIGVDSQLTMPIINRTKLLKCKYLDIDPEIDEVSDEKVYDTLVKMGAKTREVRGIDRYTKYTVTEFFKAARDGSLIPSLLSIRNLGQGGLLEIEEMCKIIISYHDRHKQNTSSNDKNIMDRIGELQKELERLVGERDRLDKEMSSVVAQISELKETVSKGGNF